MWWTIWCWHQVWNRCFTYALSPAVLILASRRRHITHTNKLFEWICSIVELVEGNIENTVTNQLWFFCNFSAQAKHMIQRSRPLKTSRMKLSDLFDSTLWCITLSTLSLVVLCSHVSKLTTPWLTLWWTEFWQMMASMRLCSWEQVSHTSPPSFCESQHLTSRGQYITCCFRWHWTDFV